MAAPHDHQAPRRINHAHIHTINRLMIWNRRLNIVLIKLPNIRDSPKLARERLEKSGRYFLFPPWSKLDLRHNLLTTA